MRTSRFTNDQIVQVLHQAESGTSVADICRKLQVTETTFYRWKKKVTGLDVSDLRELRQLREENQKLKGLVAELSLDKTILPRGAQKKIVSPASRRELVDWAKHGFQLTERRACRAVTVGRSLMRYTSIKSPDAPLRARLHELARDRITFGYPRLHVLLRRE